MLLKLTITPFASVGYHGGRWSTLEVRPHYTWLLTHIHTYVYAHRHDSTGRRRREERRNVVRGHVYGTLARSVTHPSSAKFPDELMSSHAPWLLCPHLPSRTSPTDPFPVFHPSPTSNITSCLAPSLQAYRSTSLSYLLQV